MYSLGVAYEWTTRFLYRRIYECDIYKYHQQKTYSRSKVYIKEDTVNKVGFNTFHYHDYKPGAINIHTVDTRVKLKI